MRARLDWWLLAHDCRAARGFCRSLWAGGNWPSANRQTPERRGPRGEGYEMGRSSARPVTAAVPGWSRSPAIMPGTVDPVSLSALSFWSLLFPCGAHCPVCRARGRSALVEALLSLRSFLMLLWCWVSRACLCLCSSRGLSPLLNLALGVLPKNTLCYRESPY